MARPEENTTLIATCANPACQKKIPAEYPYCRGFLVGELRQQRIVAVCQECAEQGWRPEGYRGFR